MSLDQLQGDTRQLLPVGGDGDLATTQNFIPMNPNDP